MPRTDSGPVCLVGARDLEPGQWHGLDTRGDPFMHREFLGILEASGAAGPGMDWQAMHMAWRDGAGDLTGLVPLYLRHASFGDFSHDWRWVPAWRERGLAYYPKLVTGVPYTPSPGPRLLTAPGGPDRATLAASVLELARELAVSAWQCLFLEEADRAVLAEAGLLMRRGVQFHWLNRGYRDFADYLDRFSADKRKKLKRERRAVADAGLRLEVRHGHEIEPELWPHLHRHYQTTYQRHGNHPAFDATVFPQLGQALGPAMVIFLAWDGNTGSPGGSPGGGPGSSPVASAICYRDRTTLYGRHWGSDGAWPGLHFELCYHQGIEYAIAQGLERFEPGAQGEHKVARGFEPVDTWSAFWITDPVMADALARFLARESDAVLDYQAEMIRHLPFKSALS